METQEIRLKNLKPYKNNPRVHSENQIKQIANSIKEFGFVNPIIIDEKEMILAGHGRYLASKLLELENVPVVSIKNLTGAQKKAFVIADNKIAMNANWDQDTLWDEIRLLNDMGFDLGLLAFEEMEILPIIDPNVVDDPLAEWDDMPEYDQEDLRPHRTFYVHFRNDDDIEDFFNLIKQSYTEKTKSLWHPVLIPAENESKRYE